MGWCCPPVMTAFVGGWEVVSGMKINVWRRGGLVVVIGTHDVLTATVAAERAVWEDFGATDPSPVSWYKVWIRPDWRDTPSGEDIPACRAGDRGAVPAVSFWYHIPDGDRPGVRQAAGGL